MKTLKLICILVIIAIQASIAQNKLPALDYIPQSPTAAAFSRYGEIPIDYSTGVPRIEIPIHTINVGDVSIPISISYHASGIKVRDVASEVGLGFVMNTGGVITANVVGKPDGQYPKPAFFKRSSDIDSAIVATAAHPQAAYSLATDYYNELNVVMPFKDYFSDRYSYSLCTGESGIFRRDFENEEIKLMPYSPLKIMMSYPDIKIISKNGYTHYFTGVTYNRDLFALTKIVNEKKTDSAVYYYKTKPINQYNINYWLDWWYETAVPVQNYDCFLQLDQTHPSSDLKYSSDISTDQYTTMVDSIVTKNEIIIFNYVHDRVDRLSTGDRLSEIVVKNRYSHQVIKKYQLVHSYFGSSASNNLRLRLDKVLTSGLAETEEVTTLNYNNMELPPYFEIPNHQYYYEDYWGYYNGDQKSKLFPNFFSNFNIPQGAMGPYTFGNMAPNAYYNQACMLTQITHPTGGKTVFEYESNSIEGDVGGLRIKKITSYSGDGIKSLVKSYEYGGAVSKAVAPDNYRYNAENWIIYLGISSMSGLPSCPVYVINTNSFTGFANSLRPIVLSNGAPVIYTNVTEYFGDEVSNIGKVVYTYNYEDCETRNPMPGSIDTRFFNYYHSDCGNYSPQLANVSTYKFESGSYRMIKEVDNTYLKYRQSEFNTGINFGSKINLLNSGFPTDVLLGYSTNYNYLSSLVYTDTKGYEEISLLTNTVTRDYTDNSGTTFVQSSNQKFYDNDYTFLRQEVISGSDGKVSTSEYKYPFDFSIAEPYKSMTNLKNILTPIVEQSDFKDNVPVQSMKTNYAEVFPNVIVPATVETRNGSAPYETRVRYETYDAQGNVLTASRENDVKTSYIWGYNNTYPVAKIVGADYNTAYGILSTADKNTLNSPLVTDQQVRDIVKKIRDHATMAGKMIYTYTYRPLVGMTSSTDENGLVTFYEYDSFNRLQLVKDNDGNVVKANRYHYKKQ